MYIIIVYWFEIAKNIIIHHSISIFGIVDII